MISNQKWHSPFKRRNWLVLFFLGAWVAFIHSVPLPAQEGFQEITVNPGDTLWSIANKYLKDPRRWPDIVQFNNLQSTDPTIALPGSKVKIPVLLIKEEYKNAELVSTIPEVRFKRKGESEWYEAKKDMTLKYEDSLRTMKGAQARVRFPSKEIVQINENSYVVLKPEKILQEIQLLQGDVRASRAKVIMPHGTVVKPQASGSDYQARVREDESEVVFVYKGKVDVTAQGQTVTVREGFGTRVPKSAPPLKPMPLSNFSDFDPSEMTTTMPPKANLGNGDIKINPPKPQKPAENGNRSKSMVVEDILVNYKLQLAKDENFRDIVLDKSEPTGTSFNIKQQAIPDGTYYMRVAFIDALGAMGPYSNPTMITRDTAPPSIQNLVPEEGQRFFGEESYCDVIGVVKGATMLSVNDDVIFISPTGRFNKFINLNDGKNTIKVVARDSQGNETVIERTVYYSKSK